MIALTTLPSGIRFHIYKFCNVIVDGEIVPYPTSASYDSVCVLGGYQVSRKLDVALLAVNKQLRDEVSPIIYGQNVWRMTSPTVAPRSPWTGHDVFRVQPLLFRYIVIDFDGEDVSREFKRQVIAQAWQKYGDMMDNAACKAAVSRSVHHKSCRHLRALWAFQTRLIQDMDLKVLTCNLQQCFCPNGCCSLIRRIDLRAIFMGGRNLTAEIRNVEPHSPEAERVIVEILTERYVLRHPTGILT
ncbi:MAG: hypothetical protein L6R41_004015 [Letrouitia leprolyta]|nr:MAG: hypothetical protein L6R41_004015 [Letrouitia leprolyta]